MTRPLPTERRRRAPGAGRAPLRGVPADQVIYVRVTPAELLALRELAGEEPVAAWARDVILARLGAR